MNFTEIEKQVREEVRRDMEWKVTETAREKEAHAEITPVERNCIGIMLALAVYIRSKEDEETTIKRMVEETGIDISVARRYFDRFWREGVNYWVREIGKWR